jgi:transcriptional regulator with XRE-family HTH domain
MSKLERLIRRRGLSKAEVCRQTGIHPSVMTRICKGQRQPTPVVAQQLATLLDVQVADLGHGEIKGVSEASASLLTARKRLERIEREASALGEAALAVLDALGRVEATLATARQKLRAALAYTPIAEER